MRHFFLLCIISIIILGPDNLEAQVKDKGIPFITHHSKKEYRAGTQNWDFVQADNNVLYVANKDGVLKYDGNSWELLEMPNRSEVRCLFKDDSDRIYVGAYKEFGYLKPDSSGQLGYHSLIENVQGFEFGDIWKIESLGDFLYFQSFNGLIIFNKKANTWQIEKLEGIVGFLHLAGEKLFLNHRGFGLVEVREGKIHEISGGEAFADWEIWLITKFQGDLLIGTQNNGVFIFKNGRLSPWDSEVNNFLLQNRLFSFEQTDDNLFWGSIRDGLIVSNNKGEIITHLNKSSGLNNNTILSLFIDTEENLWLGLDNGIDQVFIHSPLSYISTENEIGAGYCATIFENRIYLGTNQGLFWINNDLGGNSSNRVPFAHPITECSGQVWALEVIDNELLVGHNRGTFVIKGNNVRHIYDQSGGWNFHTLPNDDNHILQGTYNGLVIFNRGTSGLEFQTQIENFQNSSRVIHILDDHTIWMGHGYEGIFRIKLNRDLTRAEEIDVFGESSGLGTDNFNEIFKVGEDVLVGNSEGIFIYNSEIQDFQPAQFWNKAFDSDGRISKLIPGMKEDYYYFQEETSGKLKIFNDTLFIKDQGIIAPLNQSYIPPFENLSLIGEEELLIGTDRGFVHLDQNMKVNKIKEMPFHFKSFQSLRNNSSTEFHLEFTDDLDKDRPDHPLRSILFRDNDVRISFVGPTLSLPDQNNYQYKLDGQTEKWSDWTDQTEIDFTNLREGEYILKVKAKNAYGEVSSENQLYFHIQTPWHRSIIAYISYFIILILGIYLFWRISNFRMEREKRRTKLLEERRMLHKQLKLKRDSELAEKEIVKLRNDKLRASVRHKSKELANQTMGILQKNRFLTEIKEEMIKMRKSAQSDDVKSSLNKMLRKIDRNIEDENAQKVFETNFDQVHENFLLRLREVYPNLSAKDLRLCAYLRLNLSSKEIAPLLNISIRGVEISRYRLRKKLNLEHDEILADFISRY